MNDVKVTTVKGFNNGGQYVGRGRQITVSELRARELEANGLVARAKQAPEPSNKMAPEAENKVSDASTRRRTRSE